MTRTRRPLEERFQEKVDRAGGPAACWPWTGAANASRRTAGGKRGHIRVGGDRNEHVYAHRLALILATGTDRGSRWEAGHICDNPLCCNPAHLMWMTRKQNARDYVRKYGRLGVSKDHRLPDLDFKE